MQFTTLVSIAAVLVTLPTNVFGNYPTTPPSSTTPPPQSSSSGTCVTITTTDEVYCPKPTLECSTLACLELKTITQSCGCPSIYTSKTCQTACPKSCGSTSYITAVADCFPTYTPPPSYANSTQTRTKTDTHIITITTCPPSVNCTGQTTTYTSTEVCPTSTCTCVLPSVTYTTTVLPPEGTAPPAGTSAPNSNTPPVPTNSPSASPTFVESNAARKWGASVGIVLLGGLSVAVLGMI